MTLEELRRMTRATHKDKICRVLTKMRIPWRLDAEGNPVVLRKAVEAVFLGKIESQSVEIDMATRFALTNAILARKKRRGRPRVKKRGPRPWDPVPAKDQA